MNKNSNDDYVKIDNIIDVLKEHNEKIKSHDKYINMLSKMAILALNDESILANTIIEFRVKQKVKMNDNQSNPRDLLDLLTSSGTPDEFARNLDSIQGRIEKNRNNEKGWEEFNLKLDDLDNQTFIAILSRIIETMKEYKRHLDLKTKKLCKKL